MLSFMSELQVIIKVFQVVWFTGMFCGSRGSALKRVDTIVRKVLSLHGHIPIFMQVLNSFGISTLFGMF